MTDLQFPLDYKPDPDWTLGPIQREPNQGDGPTFEPDPHAPSVTKSTLEGEVSNDADQDEDE